MITQQILWYAKATSSLQSVHRNPVRLPVHNKLMGPPIIPDPLLPVRLYPHWSHEIALSCSYRTSAVTRTSSPSMSVIFTATVVGPFGAGSS